MITAVELRLYNAAASSYSLLPFFTNLACDSKYNDLGAFQSFYPLHDFTTEGDSFSGAKTLGLTDGSLVGVVALFSDGTSQEIDRYLIESTSDEKVKDGMRLRQLIGRSALVFLEDVMVYPSNWPVTAPAGHEFVNSTAGTVFRTLILRAKNRATATSSTGGISNIVETGFSGTTDSTGASWAVTLGDQNYENGVTYLRIAQDLMQRGFIDVKLDGWNLNIQNGGTMGNHVPIGTVEVRPAKNVTEMTRTTDSTDSASTVLIGGEEGTAIERHSGSAQTLIGRRRERFVSQGGIADSGTLTILADAELELVGRINTEETVGVSMTDLTPWKDFFASDWIWVRYDTDADAVERRVRQLALSVDENRNLTLGVTLNSIIEENDVRLQRKIDGYSGSGGSYGALPTSPDSSIPNAPTLISGGVTSGTFVDSQGNYVAAVTATWTAPTTNVGGSSLNDLAGYELNWRYVGDTNWSPALPSDSNVFSFSPLAPGRQIEVRVRAVDNSTNRSGWSSTVTHTVAVDTTAPIKPSTPIVTAAYAAVAVKWDGVGDVSGTPTAMPIDLDRVEIWQSASSGFTIGAGGSSLAGTLRQAGTYFVQGAFGTPIYIKLRAIDKAGNISASSSQGNATPSKIQTGDIDPNAVVSDGLPPTSSPAPESLAGLGFFIVKWNAITNHDLVNYEVHVSTTLGFTATLGNTATVVGTTTGTQFTVRQLPGTAPIPGDPDPRILDYDTTYYVRVIAFDVDGAAAQSLQSPASLFRVTGIDLQADSVTAENIVAGTLTGELFAATVIMAGTFKTADAGQRIEFGLAGINGYKSNGDLMVSFPTADGEEALFDGEFIAQGLTVKGGSSFQSPDNEFTADSITTLMRGVKAPSAVPVVTHDYEGFQLSTSSLSGADKTGVLGTFELIPSEVSQLEYHGTFWVIHQIRPTGTRSWFFDFSGAPLQLTSPNRYFDDHADWQIWSTTTLSGSAVPARDGVYTMFFHPPSSAWYLDHPGGISRYSLRNAGQTPVVGCNADDVFISEILTAGTLETRFVRPVGNADVPAPFATRSSIPGRYVNSTQLSAVQFRAGGYGTGSNRYMLAQRSSGPTQLLVNGSAPGSLLLYPGGSSDDWTSANRDAESFEAPSSQRRGIAYDGTQFWTYGSDGFLYKHTNEIWNPNATSSKVWAQQAWYDDDAGGTGLHETKPGPAISFTYKRRARMKIVLPPPTDNGGVDDPNSVRLYMGRGTTPPANAQPANSAMWRQYTGLGPTNVTTLTTTGSNPATVEGFPGGNPALFRSDDDGLQIKGDGSVRMVSGVIGPAGGATESVATYGPFYYAFIPTTISIASTSDVLMTTWTAGDGVETGETVSQGITHSAGVFTVPKAGWYRLTVGLMWAANATGLREIKIFRGSSGGVFSFYGDSAPGTVVNSITTLDRAIYLQASGQFRIYGRQETGGLLSLLGDSTGTAGGKFSYMSIDWVRP